VCPLLTLAACKNREVDMSDGEKAFTQIKTWYYDEGKLEEATIKFNEYKSKYPYHRRTAEAELLIAHAYFKQNKWPEAQVSYAEFMKLHPRHESYPLALYRHALCYYKQRNTNIDQDQTPTQDALREFRAYLDQFPAGEFAAQARKHAQECTEQLAANAQFIARFYMWKEHYHSALSVYLRIMANFPDDRQLQQEAMIRAAECYDKLSEQKATDPDTDKNIYVASLSTDQLRQASQTMAGEYLKRFPQGDFRRAATRLAGGN
jgi:outer membrane protein assembly factor BamD